MDRGSRHKSKICESIDFLLNFFALCTIFSVSFFGGFMKKICLVLLVLLVAGGAVFANDLLQYPPPLKGGNLLVDAGLGLRSTGYSGASWKIPPLFAQVEYALPVGVPISVGGMFTICQYGYDYRWSGSRYSWKWTDMTFAARGNWHWNIDVNWLDLYTGIAIGYTYSKWDDGGWSGSSYDYSGVFFSGQVGAHFYFTKMVGVMAEIGYPYWFKAGIALKF